jgi:LPLT family lysophospholipid transporter-like MFS transporter
MTIAMANIIKALGAGLLLLHIEPLLAYALVGTGAALYSPAKYGILPELAEHHLLVKANSWIEGSTILAILLGMIVGAQGSARGVYFLMRLCVAQGLSR